MITNHAPRLYQTAINKYEEEYKNISNGKGLLRRKKPVEMKDITNPRKSMERYFNKVKMMREQFNGNT